MDQYKQEEFGGYFSFESLRYIPAPWYNDYKFQSARAALCSFLEQSEDITKVHLPYFICDSVLSAVHEANKTIQFYNIDENLLPSLKGALNKSDVLYLVNYFGVNDTKLEHFMQHLSFEKVILDNAQSLFTDIQSNAVIASIYSPRKFIGVPDGGLIRTKRKIVMPLVYDTQSVNRISHLISRMSGPAENGYADYLAAEETLKHDVPKKMSHFTKFLLATTDFAKIKAKRLENYNTYLECVPKVSFLPTDGCSVPMCVPFLANNKNLKELLIKNKVYIPTYWPEVIDRVSANSFERKLVDCLCPLPSDQRYSPAQIRKVISILTEESC